MPESSILMRQMRQAVAELLVFVQMVNSMTDYKYVQMLD